MARSHHGSRIGRHALDQAAQPIYLLDDARRILYCNPACLQWLSAPASTVIGQRVDFHSGLVGPQSPWSGLCPSPNVFSGEHAEGVVWVSQDLTGRVRHKSLFVFLRPSDDAPATIMVVVGEALKENESEPKLPPTKDHAILHQQLLRYAAEGATAVRIDPLVGNSFVIRQVRAQARLAAQHADRVLIVGPVGSGREPLARSIHQAHSRGRAARLLPLNCALLDAELLTSTVEAFVRRSAEQGEQGTASLVLLEADQLQLDAQAVLLQLIERGRLTVPVIATARQELATLDTFRPDLAAALSTLTIRLPGLSARLEDLPLLIQSLLEQGNVESSRQIQGMTPEALDRLLNHCWRRNLQELAEVVDLARQRCRSTIVGIEDLPENIGLSAEAERFPPTRAETINLDNFLGAIERELIQRALQTSDGNRAQAARLLGISRARLLRRLEALGFECK
jgi:DNA-binding NtrC family response regulator